jgi:hypothetical protein
MFSSFKKCCTNSCLFNVNINIVAQEVFISFFDFFDFVTPFHPIRIYCQEPDPEPDQEPDPEPDPETDPKRIPVQQRQ